ncbi:MAG: hypothetical protein JST94_04745 [Bacteroidetes bacterium]|nr:hypothetical protein [Bacteroidota bacterium]MBS1591256.1 hypothetical protein [Bacteroidota bacterium]MBS1639118.1 hypothetical protein [Bacteroidota bacterium]MBS1641805.1 hypothetical protein [Bacteroidota bacterium]MBS1670748.1 hypothetical protein [Bacteroidota bacterium]
MKKTLLIFFLIGCIVAFSQQPPAQNKNGGAGLQGLKIAYITKQLDLTTNEAQMFWPVYFNYINELKQARQNNKTNEIASDEAILNVKKKYFTEFKKVLGSDVRANKVYTIERDFTNEVKKELEKRQQERKQMHK